jgi:hypothetical protein
VTGPEETLAALKIYLANRIEQARHAARTAVPESPTWWWGHLTGEELGSIETVISNQTPGQR